MSDVPDLDYNISQDFTAAYKVSQPAARLQNEPRLFTDFDTPTHVFFFAFVRNIPFTERCR